MAELYTQDPGALSSTHCSLDDAIEATKNLARMVEQYAWSAAHSVMDYSYCTSGNLFEVLADAYSESSSTSDSYIDTKADATSAFREPTSIATKKKPYTTSAAAGFFSSFARKSGITRTAICDRISKASAWVLGSCERPLGTKDASWPSHGSGVEIEEVDNSPYRNKHRCWDDTFGNFDTDHRTLIDTPAKLKAFLPELRKLKRGTTKAPELALDCEGYKLGRSPGTWTLLQMRIRSMKHTYIFDVLRLGCAAMFHTKSRRGPSLREILESEKYIKIWWDLRKDQEALYHHFGIVLAGVVDVQLMELATRNSPQVSLLCRLSNAVCVEYDKWMTVEESENWLAINRKAKHYFDQSDYECFNERPLSDLALEYSAGDVEVLEKLYSVYYQRMTEQGVQHPKITEQGWELIHAETKTRASEAMQPNPAAGSYLAPKSFASLPIRPSWRQGDVAGEILITRTFDVSFDVEIDGNESSAIEVDIAHNSDIESDMGVDVDATSAVTPQNEGGDGVGGDHVPGNELAVPVWDEIGTDPIIYQHLW